MFQTVLQQKMDGTIHAPRQKNNSPPVGSTKSNTRRGPRLLFREGDVYQGKGCCWGNPKDSKRGKIGKHLGKIANHLGKMRTKSPSPPLKNAIIEAPSHNKNNPNAGTIRWEYLPIAISNYSWRMRTQFVNGLLRELQDFYSYID